MTRGSLARDPAINPSPSSPAFPTSTFPLETERKIEWSPLVEGKRDQAGKSDRGRESAHALNYSAESEPRTRDH